MPASPSTIETSTRTGRSISRARRRRSPGPTASSRRSCPYTNADWEKLSIFLNFLVPKLPAPQEEDLSKGILEAIDMDSYRVEKQAAQRVQLADQDAEIDPVPTDGGGHKPEPELDRLSNIIRGVQRPVRQHHLGRRRPHPAADRDGNSEQGRRRHGLSEREAELRQAERPHRARQGAWNASSSG